MSEHNKTVSKESLQPESEQFDRWWNEQGYKLDGDLFDNLQAAFLAGQEAKEAECFNIAIDNAVTQRNLTLGMEPADIVCYRIAAAIKARGKE
jgi:hypothetical protein